MHIAWLIGRILQGMRFQLTVMRTLYCVSVDLTYVRRRTKARRLCWRDKSPLHNVLVLAPRPSSWCLPLDRNKDFSLRYMALSITRKRQVNLLRGEIGRIKYRKTPNTWAWRRRKTCWEFDIVHHRLSHWRAQVSQLECSQRNYLTDPQKKKSCINKLQRGYKIIMHTYKFQPAQVSPFEIHTTKLIYLLVAAQHTHGEYSNSFRNAQQMATVARGRDSQ